MKCAIAANKYDTLTVRFRNNCFGAEAMLTVFRRIRSRNTQYKKLSKPSVMTTSVLSMSRKCPWMMTT